eukprot:SM000069S20742  [mRNA]  locus=s69:487971:489558:- [translate_table: standard]
MQPCRGRGRRAHLDVLEEGGEGAQVHAAQLEGDARRERVLEVLAGAAGCGAGLPYVELWPAIPEGEPIPWSRPNAGAVQGRNHRKRMMLRAQFAAAQAQQSIALQKAATARREEARRRRWAEASERAHAWAERQAAQGLDDNQAGLPSS